MKCLSILQPWAGTILSGSKLVENRSWFRPVPEPFDCLIHAGKKYDADSEDFIIEICEQLGVAYPNFMRCTKERGAILGVVRIVECTRPLLVAPEQFPWAFGPWCFLLENPRTFATPIPYRGQLSFFDIDDHIVREALSAVAAESLISSSADF